MNSSSIGMNMRKIMMLAVVILMATMSVSAQSSLSGRVYHNANILAGKIDKIKDLTDKDINEAKAKAYEKAEKEKGRKLTEAEKAEMDEKVQESLEKAKVLSKAMTTAVTMEFTNATDVVIRMDMHVDDAALKVAGISWIKRKAIKAALAVAPKSEKGKYIQKGNLVILTDDEEPDTLQLSGDGKYLIGMMDKDQITLTRTK